MKRILLVLIVGALAATGFALAQDNERSRFVRFVERQISTEDRQIRLGTIDGALSSDVRISEITIADREGVWLTITDVHLVWSRLALVRGRLDVDLLEASSITIARPPNPAEGDGEPIDDTPFQLPDLPVEVLIDRLAVPEVDIPDGVIGTAARLSIDGAVSLAGGALETNISVERLDEPGSFGLEAAFDNESRELDVELGYSEPEGGVIANALNIEGAPQLAFAVQGSGPLDDFSAGIGLSSEGETLLEGTAQLAQSDEGQRFILNISGNLNPLVPALYGPFVDEGSRLVVDVTRRPDGTISIPEGELSSGVAALTFSAEVGADGVPSALDVSGRLAREDGEPIALPGGGGAATIGAATIEANLSGEAGRFEFLAEVDRLDTDTLQAPRARLAANGTVENLANAEARAVTFTVDGGAEELGSDNPGLAEALGRTLTLAANGSWNAGRPVRIENASLSADALDASFSGRVGDSLIGSYSLEAARLAAFAGLAGRDLDGAIDLSADGAIGFDGTLDLTLDAEAQDLAVGIPAVDGLLEGTTRLSGGAARQGSRIAFDAFSVENPALSLQVDGEGSPSAADLAAELALSEIARIDDRLGGSVSGRVTVSGSPQAPDLRASLSSPGLAIGEERVESLEARFDGRFQRGTDVAGDVDGSLTVNARVNGEVANLSASLASTNNARRLDSLSLDLAGAEATGQLALLASGLLEGDLQLDIPDLGPLAALALVDAEGTVSGRLGLGAANGAQTIDLTATARQVVVPGAEVGFADVDLAVEDPFAVPVLAGRADLRAIRAGGFEVRSASLNAAREGEATDLSLSADLGTGQLAADGRLTREPDGFAARISRFNLSREGLAATLQSPTTISVAGETITISPANLSVGEGNIEVEGRVGETVDLTATLDQVALDIADAVRPQLGLAGTVSGRVEASGERAAPDATFSLDAAGVTAAILQERGIDPLSIVADGRVTDGTVQLNTLQTTIAGGSLSASGTVGETLDIDVEVDALPLALANAAQADLGLSGTLSGRANVTGERADPVADIEAQVENASARLLDEAGLPPVSARLAARYADGTADIAEGVINLGTGTVTVSGQVGETLDLTAELDAIPLAYANAAQPGLGVSGELDGTVRATGSLQNPDITFNIDVPSVTAAPLERAGLPPASITAEGTADRNGVDLNPAEVTIGGASLVATGRAGRSLDISVTADSVPVALANGAAPGLGLSGTLSGQADVSGSASNPRGTFDLAIAALSANALESAGVGPLEVDVAGNLSGGRVVLDRATARGPQVSVDASGSIPLSGDGLDVRAQAEVPLLIANRFVATRGARFGGQATADVTVTGSFAQPLIRGSAQASGVTLTDPQTGLDLSGGTLSASFNGDTLVLERFTASAPDGGSLTVSGRLGILSGFDAAIDIAAQDLRLSDGRLYAVTVDADLSITGPLFAGPLLSGTVFVDRAEISVPSQLGGSAQLIAVQHFNIPPEVLETLRRARAGPFRDEGGRAGGGTALNLDLTIDAPARIFIRGRGIDAELGGAIRLTGPVEDIVPVGEFELIRGRLVILGQRIDFREGSLAFFGDLTPSIRLVAETQSDTVTVRVIVEGDADDPVIRIESEPDLPQDEALAQLLFGRSISDLSAFQLAQLAASAAELAGSGGGPSLLEQVRVISGFDDLDVTTGPEGGTTVRAGRYIASNVYLGVQAGTRSSGVSLNLDVTDSVTVRGEALTNESTIGVFFEREY